MIKVFGTGNLTKDPEILQVNGQKLIVKCTIASKSTKKDKDGNYGTEYYDCVAFENRADYLAKYCHKGNKLVINGTLQIEVYDAQDGSKRKATKIIIDNVENVTPRENDAPTKEVPSQVVEQSPQPLINDDDLPF